MQRDRLEASERQVTADLLALRNQEGYWTGELSTSALSTATAVMALQQVKLQRIPATDYEYQALIDGGLKWLAEHQNEDGGWGDTIKSFSNISTTMLAHAVFYATQKTSEYQEVIGRAKEYIQDAGGVEAVIRRYGKDKTFSVPILTHCALAGLVDWPEIPSLPFELACVPHQFYAAIRLPVVSYALPALIAIGQVRHHFAPSWNPIVRGIRNLSIGPSLRKLESIQPTGGGFLEATPLTSFVTMSLAAKGLTDHPVVINGIKFIVNSVLKDGSWPIDTNLATWVTSLSVNSLANDECLPDLTDEQKQQVLNWLLNQQYRRVHPYTNAAPGGWAWTDLPGGVPDADDTPGALLALMNLERSGVTDERIESAIQTGCKWLLEIQNRDGGWPTFCRGWGALPFDRSSPDITAHCLRALMRAQDRGNLSRVTQAVENGFEFLLRQQRPDGSWIPLWFGNQYLADEINPVYGTAKVVAAFRARDHHSGAYQAGLRWLRENQNDDGGWGGDNGPSSVEETALAVEALLYDSQSENVVARGLEWLVDQVEAGKVGETAPIGFYFAKLWYFEQMYPLVFAHGALRAARVMNWARESASAEAN